MIGEHFHYVRPGANPFLVASEGAAWRQLLARSYALVVIDGVTDALTMFGYATKDNDGITAFSRDVPRRLADRPLALALAPSRGLHGPGPALAV